MRRKDLGHLLTAGAAEKMDHGEGNWELWDGVLLVCEPAGGGSGPLGTTLGARLLQAVEPGSGWVGDASTGYLLRRDPDRLLSPDVSYVSRERLERWPKSGFVECVPDLVAEIRSPRDSWTYVVERGGVWIAHGVSVVWLIDPLEERAVTLRPLEAPEETSRSGAISAAPVLPAVSVSLDALFGVLD